MNPIVDNLHKRGPREWRTRILKPTFVCDWKPVLIYRLLSTIWTDCPQLAMTTITYGTTDRSLPHVAVALDWQGNGQSTKHENHIAHVCKKARSTDLFKPSKNRYFRSP